MILDSQCPTGIGEVQISHSLLAHPNTADSGLLASHSLWGTDATAEYRDLGNSDIWIDTWTPKHYPPAVTPSVQDQQQNVVRS